MPQGRGTRVLRGLLALVVLLALGAGIPIALVSLTSTSFPQGLPDLSLVLGDLTARDDGTLFFAVITVAAWLGWATFALAIALEIPAQLRGVPAVRVRGLGLQQSLAAGLVATALTVVLVPGSASAADRPAGEVAARAQPLGTDRHRPGQPVPSAAPGLTRSSTDHRRPDGEVYVVRHGDTLWDIAAEHLGDGARWRRIAAHNYGRQQPDGGHLDHSHVLQPGWQLVLPATPGSPAGTGHRRVVQPGETLSDIAEHELGRADRYPEILRASAPIVQPDGRHLTNADRIYPGWSVQIPGAARGRAGRTETEPREPLPAAAPTPSPTVPRGPQTAPPRPETGASRGTDPLAPSWSSTTAEPAPQSGHASVPVAQPLDGEETGADAGLLDEAVDEVVDDVADVRTAGGIGGLLAACVLLLLGARRARQQRRRRPGERIPLPARSVLATEARLRSVAEVAGVSHIDLALRALAAEHRALGRPLPGLRSARLTRTHLELYFTAEAALPVPWAATSDPTVWVLPHEELTAQVETDMRAPYPGLMTVGHDLEDAHVLIDLEEAATLALEGDRRQTLPVLAATAVELATNPWADDLLVTLVGCLPELPAAVATGRLRHVERPEQLIADLEGRAADVERVLRDAGVDDLATARGTGVADDAWSPEIVLLPDDVSGPVRHRLEDILFRVPRVGVAAVTAGGRLPGEWRLQLDAGGDRARLEPGAVTLRPQRLAGEEYEHILELLGTADAEPVPGPSWASRAPSQEQALADLPAPTAAASPEADDEPVGGEVRETGVENIGSAEVVPLPGRPPLVRLLGPVDVVGTLGPEPVTLKDGRAVANHLGRATALVAYLACRPEGATTEQLSEALSPVRRLSSSTLWSLASRTRKWLGSDPDGVPYFPRASSGASNRLHAAVRTDWSLWLELVGDDVTTTPLPRLVDALGLVRGRPLEGVTERHYTWAEPLRQDMVAAVVDVAHEVVRRALQVPDVAVARRAATVGRLVDQTNELLWRDALRVEHVAGNREAQTRLLDQLAALTDELETDLEPATEALIAELGHARPQTSRGPMSATAR
jgi:hypothetical protein